jgi:hypothetical protein
MRRNLLRGIGSSFVFLVGLAAVSAVVAQTTPGENVPAVVTNLRSAHKLLAEADRDYEGHRAKAAEEIHNALRELGYRPKKAPPGSAANPGTVAPKTPSGQAPVHEPQANSDAQLRQALEILQGVSQQLGNGQPKVAAKVKAAIGEINTALGIR